MEPRARYFSLIDPHSRRVSIYNGGEIFLREYRRTPEASRHLLTAHWCQSEVCNGGFLQFFSNSTGVLAPEAVEGFEAMGLPRLAAVVRRALGFFERRFPRDRKERMAALGVTGGGLHLTEEQAAPFRQLDDEFFKLHETESGGFEAAANAYAVAHGG